MPTIKEIYNSINDFAPYAYKESWDPCGLQLGDPNKEVKKILFALDLSKRAVDRIINEGFDLLVTHHPVLFSAVSSITADLPEQREIIRLIQADAGMISAHTNVDRAPGGTATALANKFFNYSDWRKLEERASILEPMLEQPNFGHGRVLVLDQPMSYGQLHNELKIKFAMQDLAWHVAEGRTVNTACQKLAFCPGAMADDFILPLLKAKVDTLICGEIKYHMELQLTDSGVTVFKLGHDVSERVVMPVLRAYLGCCYPDLYFAMDPGIDYTFGNPTEPDKREI